jgi:glycosyltransferase involved in cell wall biosynthesis
MSMSSTRNQKRALVLTPFLSIGGPTSRPLFAASVLSELMPVDVVTSDFDHAQKAKFEQRPYEQYDRVVYLKTRPYSSNVGAARMISHLLLALKAAAYFRRNRDRYSVVYVTAPFNVMAWLVFKLAGTKTKVIDVVDIWPDVLPFPPLLRCLLAPVFRLWKWFFKSAVAMADLVMAVSDEFINEAVMYANSSAKVERFYIGHVRFEPAVTKQEVFTIVYVGNIGHLYDFDTLVDVLSEDDLRCSVQIFVIGKGDRQEWLARELEHRKIQHQFFGVVFEPHRLGEILRSCHVGFNGYINTTAAFSYKAATYLAAGLPLLNSMTGDLQHLVSKHGLGENYEGGNRQQLRDRLLRLCYGTSTSTADNCARFFASEVESSKIAADMRCFFLSNIRGIHEPPIPPSGSVS